MGSHCVECARPPGPTSQTRARYWSARQPTLVTYTLIAINLAVFVWIAHPGSRSLTGDRVLGPRATAVRHRAEQASSSTGASGTAW